MRTTPAYCAVALGVSLALLLTPSVVLAAPGSAASVPPLLRFAERYTAEQAEQRVSHSPASRQPSSGRRVKQTEASAAINRQDKRLIARQAQQIAALQKALKAAQEKASRSQQEQTAPPLKVPPIDFSTLAANLSTSLRQLSGLSPSEQQIAGKITSLTQQLSAAKQQAAQQEEARTALAKQRDALEQQLARVQNAATKQGQNNSQVQALQEMIGKLRQKRHSDEQKINSSQQQQTLLQERLDALQKQHKTDDDLQRELRNQVLQQQQALKEAATREQVLKLQQQTQQDTTGHDQALQEAKATVSVLQQQLREANAERDRALKDTKSALAARQHNQNSADQQEKVLESTRTALSTQQQQTHAAEIARDQALNDAKAARTAHQQDTTALNAARAQLNLLQNQLDLLKTTREAATPAPTGTKEPKTQQSASQTTAMTLPEIDSHKLEKASVRQGYAIGMSLGAEILLMQQAHQKAGNPVDTNLILAGITDAFRHTPKLTSEQFRLALKDADIAAGKEPGNEPLPEPRPAAVATPVVRKEDLAFMKAYKKRQWAKKSPSGFWYEIHKPGDQPLKPDDTVAIVLQESLTDGTMVKDMEKSQKVIQEVLSKMPPLFREALSKIKNHGEMTLVVPPELAYGSSGYPPLIPPNAVMIYHMRIANAWHAGKVPGGPKK